MTAIHDVIYELTREALAQHIIGWEVSLAEDWLRKNEYRFRIVQKDEIYYMITHDFNPDRFNLVIKDGHVAEVDFG